MTDTRSNTHPYELEVGLAPNSDTFFQWTIRKSGKVFQRADRRYPSEAEAWRKGTATVEALLSGPTR